MPVLKYAGSGQVNISHRPRTEAVNSTHPVRIFLRDVFIFVSKGMRIGQIQSRLNGIIP
jgi:hypothetical protein